MVEINCKCKANRKLILLKKMGKGIMRKISDCYFSTQCPDKANSLAYSFLSELIEVIEDENLIDIKKFPTKLRDVFYEMD